MGQDEEDKFLSAISLENPELAKEVKKYHLKTNMIKCPLTYDPYFFEIDTTGDEDIFIVTSPLHLLEEPYTESRFGVFTFEAGDHGFIKGTQKSWAE